MNVVMNAYGMSDLMLVSVIIPALNEEKYIIKCLESIITQNYSFFEIIVVANGCDDKTAEVAKRYANKVIETQKKGISYARNLGAEHSNGEIVLFVDADCILNTDLLSKVVETVKSGYVGGSCNTMPDTNSLIAISFWTLYNIISRYMQKTNGLVFFRRDVFFALKFNENLNAGEDIEIYHNARKYGRLAHITKTYIKTSMRRFEQDGYIKTLLIWEFSHFFPISREYKEIR